MRTSSDVVQAFIDRTFPEVGKDCPHFPVMVVLFSAAFLRSTNIEILCDFAGYRREYLEAIAANMSNNKLWVGDEYPASGWLRDGRLDQDEFAQQVEAAIGMLWYQEAIECGAAIDVIEVSHSWTQEPTC